MSVRQAEVSVESHDNFQDTDMVPNAGLMDSCPPSTVSNIQFGRIIRYEACKFFHVPTLGHLWSTNYEILTN